MCLSYDFSDLVLAVQLRIECPLSANLTSATARRWCWNSMFCFGGTASIHFSIHLPVLFLIKEEPNMRQNFIDDEKRTGLKVNTGR